MTDSVTVAATMIVRNEQNFLPACLESLQGRVDEIIVVDTGSTDNSIDIASRYGARLLHHAWERDFAAARNMALDAVSCPWVLYIDADERLSLPEGGVLADYIDPGSIAGFVRFRPKTGYTRYREWRLFRSAPGIRFAGQIHETIVPSIREASAREGLPIVQTAVEINHLGYDGDQSHKHGRNLPLLQSAVRSNPERVYYWYHLSQTLDALGRREEAVAAALEGLAQAERADSEDQLGAASLIHQFLARIELAQGANPLPRIATALGHLPEDYALWFLRARALLDHQRPLETLEITQKLRAIDPAGLSDGLLAFDSSIFADKACELAALACLQLGRRAEAAAHFAMASRLAPSDLSYRIRAVALGNPPASVL
jgi:glycosyltransferase involved in cell wall biosynthesis